MLEIFRLGFNGGSTFGANPRSAVAITNTNLAGSMGGLAWMLLDFRLERKWSAVGYCTGAICGLVAITPAAGFVSYGPAICIGVVSAIVCNLLTTLKGFFAFDDAMDIYACRTSCFHPRHDCIAPLSPLPSDLRRSI